MGQGSVRRCDRSTGIRDPQGDVDDGEEHHNTFRDRVSLADSSLSDDTTRHGPENGVSLRMPLWNAGGYLLV